jgi:hypothetical protein
MYRSDRSPKAIERIERTSFADILFGERRHFYEWIAAARAATDRKLPS